jgi:hypothetical protein
VEPSIAKEAPSGRRALASEPKGRETFRIRRVTSEHAEDDFAHDLRGAGDAGE